jgi:hypothetical protein
MDLKFRTTKLNTMPLGALSNLASLYGEVQPTTGNTVVFPEPIGQVSFIQDILYDFFELDVSKFEYGPQEMFEDFLQFHYIGFDDLSEFDLVILNAVIGIQFLLQGSILEKFDSNAWNLNLCHVLKAYDMMVGFYTIHEIPSGEEEDLNFEVEELQKDTAILGEQEKALQLIETSIAGYVLETQNLRKTKSDEIVLKLLADKSSWKLFKNLEIDWDHISPRMRNHSNLALLHYKVEFDPGEEQSKLLMSFLHKKRTYAKKKKGEPSSMPSPIYWVLDPDGTKFKARTLRKSEKPQILCSRIRERYWSLLKRTPRKVDRL